MLYLIFIAIIISLLTYIFITFKRKIPQLIQIVTKVQILAWLIFIMSDLIQEIILKSDIYWVISIFFVCIIPIWYLNKEKQLCNKINISKFKLFILAIVIWIIETTIIGCILWFAVSENLWIKQNSIPGIWNGLEYLGFPFILAILPILIIIIVKIVKFLYIKLRKL